MDRIIDLLDKYERYRRNVINLQASENYLCPHARLALGSDLGSRYSHVMNNGINAYGGTDLIEEIKTKTENSIKALYSARFAEIRPPGAHIAAEMAILSTVKTNGKIMAIDEKDGGYTGYSDEYLGNMLSYKYSSIPYDNNIQEIDYEALERKAAGERPDAIILGQSFFVKPYDLKRIKEICDKSGSFLIYDGSHVMGLIAGKKFQPDAIKYSDILFGSTHKSLFGPQGGIVLTQNEELFKKIEENTVWKTFDNYHPNRIAALGVVAEDFLEFGETYAKNVIQNSKNLAYNLEQYGIEIKCGPWYSESHQIIMKDRKANFIEISKILEKNNIIVDREGRIGTSEITRLGLSDMDGLASVIADSIKGKDTRSKVAEILKNTGVKYCR
ncbi:serine hydroxymethyltransferase [Caldiplasma sukawensis]